MTVTKTTNRWSDLGDGVTKEFGYDNIIFAASDLKVYLDGLQQTAGYTVTGVGDPAGGAVTFDVAPASGAEVTRVRDVPATQEVDYQEAGKFPAEVHEKALDRLTVLVQQQAAEVARSLRLAPGDGGADLPELPAASARANRYIAFDGAGSPIMLPGTSEDVDVSDRLVTPAGEADQKTLADLMAERVVSYGEGADATVNVPGDYPTPYVAYKSLAKKSIPSNSKVKIKTAAGVFTDPGEDWDRVASAVTVQANIFSHPDGRNIGIEGDFGTDKPITAASGMTGKLDKFTADGVTTEFTFAALTGLFQPRHEGDLMVWVGGEQWYAEGDGDAGPTDKVFTLNADRSKLVFPGLTPTGGADAIWAIGGLLATLTIGAEAANYQAPVGNEVQSYAKIEGFSTSLRDGFVYNGTWPVVATTATTIQILAKHRHIDNPSIGVYSSGAATARRISTIWKVGSKRSFWNQYGDPKTPGNNFGILCFNDIEVQGVVIVPASDYYDLSGVATWSGYFRLGSAAAICGFVKHGLWGWQGGEVRADSAHISGCGENGFYAPSNVYGSGISCTVSGCRNGFAVSNARLLASSLKAYGNAESGLTIGENGGVVSNNLISIANKYGVRLDDNGFLDGIGMVSTGNRQNGLLIEDEMAYCKADSADIRGNLGTYDILPRYGGRCSYISGKTSGAAANSEYPSHNQAIKTPGLDVLLASGSFIKTGNENPVRSSVAFRASLQIADATPASGAAVPLDNEDFDSHNAFDPATATFTAPATGYYVLEARVRLAVATTGGFYRLDFIGPPGGSAGDSLHYFYGDMAQGQTLSASALLHMQANETVKVAIFFSGVTGTVTIDSEADGRFTWVSGYRVA